MPRKHRQKKIKPPSQPEIKDTWWNGFLTSLATSGGNLFLLAFFVIMLISIIVPIMVKFGPSSPTAITLTGIFSAFTGAFLNQMKGSRIDTPPPHMASTTTTTTATMPPPEKKTKRSRAS